MTDPAALLTDLAGPAGASLRVERADGTLLWAGAAGAATPGGPPMTAETPFHVASIGKSFTAALVLQLAEAGRFGPTGLDTPFAEVAPFAPAIAARLVQPGTTLGQLLRHTAGLRDTFEDGPEALGGPQGPADGSLMAHMLRTDPGRRWEPWNPARPEDREAGVINWFLATGTAAAPLSPPGDRFHYSDTGFMLLALAAEAAAGAPWPELVRARLLAPLGLGQSVYTPWREPRPTTLAGPDADVWLGEQPVLASGGCLSFDYGGGGLVATPGALIAFLRALLAGRLFRRPETLAAMTAMATPPGLAAPRRAVGAGLFETGFGPFRFIGHSGAWSGRMLFVPDLGLYLAGTLNRAGAPPGWHADMLQSILEIAP
jgi:D-alanyl-D-alanine carboxypeptidase